MVAPVAAGALVVGVANGAGVCAAVPLVIGAVGPTVTPGTAVCGVSLMPRPNGLSLVLRTVVPPAAAEPACSVAAGLACVTVLVPMALQQLAALGILNPSEDQIRTAMFGGTITTLNGVYQLPGIPLK